MDKTNTTNIFMIFVGYRVIIRSFILIIIYFFLHIDTKYLFILFSLRFCSYESGLKCKKIVFKRRRDIHFNLIVCRDATFQKPMAARHSPLSCV